MQQSAWSAVKQGFTLSAWPSLETDNKADRFQGLEKAPGETSSLQKAREKEKGVIRTEVLLLLFSLLLQVQVIITATLNWVFESAFTIMS